MHHRRSAEPAGPPACAVAVPARRVRPVPCRRRRREAARRECNLRLPWCAGCAAARPAADGRVDAGRPRFGHAAPSCADADRTGLGCVDADRTGEPRDADHRRRGPGCSAAGCSGAGRNRVECTCAGRARAECADAACAGIRHGAAGCAGTTRANVGCTSTTRPNRAPRTAGYADARRAGIRHADAELAHARGPAAWRRAVVVPATGFTVTGRAAPGRGDPAIARTRRRGAECAGAESSHRRRRDGAQRRVRPRGQRRRGQGARRSEGPTRCILRRRHRATGRTVDSPARCAADATSRVR